MKKISLACKSIASVALATAIFTTAASAAGTATSTLDVRLTIEEGCQVEAGALDFGTQQGLRANTDVQTTINVYCTPGASYTVGLGTGAHSTGTDRNLSNGTQT